MMKERKREMRDKDKFIHCAIPPTTTQASPILITKLPPPRTQHRPQRDLFPRREFPQIDFIPPPGFRTRRVIQQRARARNRALAMLRVPGLPDRPQPVELRVVQEEHGVAGGGEEIGHVAADGVVPARVQAQHARFGAEVEDVLECGDVGLGEEGGDGFAGDGGAGDGLVDVADEAVGVVGEVFGVLVEGGVDAVADGAEGDDVVGEGACGYAAATGAGGDFGGDYGGGGEVDYLGGGGVGFCDAVAGEAVFGAVEDGGCGEVGGVQGPVPVAVGVSIWCHIGNGTYGWAPL